MNREIISLKNLSKSYNIAGKPFYALKEINLSFGEGEFTGIVGPSGSGKTTLLNIIGSLDSPSSGEAIVLEKNISSLNHSESARLRNYNIGFIFQVFNLLPVYTVYENVLFPLLLKGSKEKDVRDRVMDIITKVGLSDQSKKRPSQLSGGQCQRVAIARALVKDPPLILADEPTANLDTENSLQILELMRELNRQYKAAVVFSTHDEKVTRFIRREVKLEDGRVLADKNNLNGGSQ